MTVRRRIANQIGRIHLPWWRAIWLGWGLVMLAAILPNSIPASFWFEVEDVRVYDARAGEAPRMAVTRTIKRPFRAEWTVTVRRNGGQGFHFYCGAYGESDYSPDAVFPAPLTLDWWTWPTHCDLTPGEYRVITVWTLHPPGLTTKQVRQVSNVFAVRP